MDGDKALEKISPAKITLADAERAIQSRKEMEWKGMRVEKGQDAFQKNVTKYGIESSSVETGPETGDELLFLWMT